MMNARALLSIAAIGFIATACERYLTTQATVHVLPQTAPCGDRSQFNPTDICLQIGLSADGPFFRNKILRFTHETSFRYKLRVQSAAWNNELVDEIFKH